MTYDIGTIKRLPLARMTTFARVCGLLPVVATAVLAVVILVSGARWHGVTVAAVWPIVVLCVFFVFIAIRAVMLRVTIDDEVLRVTQWFRVTSVPLADIRAVGLLPYDGFLNWGNIDGSGARFPMVAVEIAASASRVRGFVVTTSRPRSATLKAARLHRAIVDRGFAPDLRARRGANSSG